MNYKDIKIGSNRSFGVVFFVVFLLIGLWPILKGNELRIWAIVISLIFLILGILNGKPKWPHYGIDFAAKEGTKIKAMLDGTATMVEPDLFYTGGTLIFDHGHGISTLYMHLKDIHVKKGQKVKQGEIIGTVGSTGRSTGPHLDVRLNWFGVRLDPATVLDLN